jgi:hypothetical protein
MTSGGPQASGGLSNRTIILVIGVVALVVSFLLNSGPTSSGFESGQQVGYIVGQSLLAMLIAWVVLKYVLRRP